MIGFPRSGNREAACITPLARMSFELLGSGPATSYGTL